LRILIYGLPGMGKTTLMHDMVRASPEHRIFVVDRADEWLPDAFHWRGDPPKNLVVVKKDKPPRQFDESGVYVFEEWEGLDVARLACEVGNVVFVDDEIDLIANYKNWDESPIREMVHRGRHLRNRDGEVSEVHLVGAARRPQSLHTDLSEQADAVYIFRVQGSRTLDRLRRDSHIEDGEWDRVRSLPKFHYRKWPSDTNEDAFASIEPLGNQTESTTRSPGPTQPGEQVSKAKGGGAKMSPTPKTLQSVTLRF
jgi:hypothetical protein